MLKSTFLALPACSTAPDLAIACWEEIAMQYGAKRRAYHNLQHLEQMLLGLNDWSGQSIQDPELLHFSIYYHDLIYRVPGSKNELRSAERAKEVLVAFGLEGERINRCYDQILATRTHEISRPDDPDQAILLDLDLAILGSKRPAYVIYSQQIRREFQIIPAPIYRSGRKKVLRQLLALPHLFHTDFYRARLEDMARENLQWELEQL